MSMRHTLRRAWPVALVAVPAALLATPARDAGITYDFKVSSASTQGGKSRDGTAMAGRAQMTADRARIDLSEARNGGPMFDSKGGYVVVTDGGAKMYMVDPSEKQYFAFNMEQMLAGVSSTLKMVGGMVKMTMSDVKMDVQDLGAGESIAGHSTRHLRQTQSYTLSVSVLGRKSSTTTADTTEIWVATDLKNVGNPFLRMGNAAAGLDFGNPDFKAQYQSVQAKMPAGLPLRSVSRSHSTDDKGNTTLATSTMEVTNIQKGDIPASAFAIPGDYTEVQMPFAELAALGDSLDAARGREDARANASAKADAAKADASGEGITDAVKEGVKEGAKQGVKEEAAKKIRGIFRKP